MNMIMGLTKKIGKDVKGATIGNAAKIVGGIKSYIEETIVEAGNVTYKDTVSAKIMDKLAEKEADLMAQIELEKRFGKVQQATV